MGDTERSYILGLAMAGAIVALIRLTDGGLVLSCFIGVCCGALGILAVMREERRILDDERWLMSVERDE